MQKGKLVLLVLTIACGLVGCGQDKMPDVCSVSINKDGGITHQIVGNFDQKYYEVAGLEELAADRVEEYCEENGADRVALESVEEKDGKVFIRFNYASDEDYSEFNHRELFVGTLPEAGDKGYELEGVAFISADGKPIEIGYMEDYEDAKVVIIGTKASEELMVNTYGKVLYINQTAVSDLDVSFYGKKGVYITHPAGEGTDESVLSYIIFE